MVKYYEKNGEQVSGEAIGGRLITTMTVGGALVSNPLITDIESDGWVEYIPSTPGDVQISAADWTALITAVNQLTGSTLVYSDPVSDITTAITALRNGVTFANIANWWSLPTLLCNDIRQYITSIVDGRVSTVVADAFRNNTIITRIELSNCISVGTYAFASSHIEIVKLPALTTLPSEIFYQDTYLKYVDMSSCTNNAYRGFYQTFNIQAIVTWTGVPCTSGYANNKLYLLHFKGSIINSLNLCYDNHSGLLWNPTEAVDANSTSLVPQQEWDIDENGDPIDCTQFTSNRDKFIYCFKHLFMPAFGTVSNQTLTLKSTVYDVVMNDNEVSTYFSTRGWTVARVA